MRVFKSSNSHLEVFFSRDELHILRCGLGEIILGFHLDDFKEKIGCLEGVAGMIFTNLDQIYRHTYRMAFNDAQGNQYHCYTPYKPISILGFEGEVLLKIPLSEFEIIRNALYETLLEIDHDGEFECRVQTEREEGVKLLKELDEVLNIG